MKSILIHNALIVNEGQEFHGSVLIEGDCIAAIYKCCVPEYIINQSRLIDATGKILIPGVIDDQVHFRDFELSYKGDIKSESRAAVAGGVTSYMDMPNTVPPVTSIDILNKRFEIAEQNSFANYSFYFGATNDNFDQIMAIDPKMVCGIKVFMGSSTGNMLVDKDEVLEKIFANAPVLIATHCEDEAIIKNNLQLFTKKYSGEIPVTCHPEIRSRQACYKSTAKAVELAKKHGTRLHVLHISTADEVNLFSNTTEAKNKKITAEVCVHHLWFSADDYEKYGTRIKWNPAIKNTNDRQKLLDALKNGFIDVIATDHAPHTIDEKAQTYLKAPSGGPLVQHSLIAMCELYHKKQVDLTFIVDKMCHKPAEIFNINNRGFIREGYFADLVIIDPNKSQTIDKQNILYKCGWSPFEGTTFKSTVTHTFVNGKLVFDNGHFDEVARGERLQFESNVQLKS